MQGDRTSLKGIVCTHGHFDHISGVAAIRSEFNVPSYLHSYDLRLVNQVNLYRKLAGANSYVMVPTIDVDLKEVRELPLGDESIRVIHAPGHTKGSVIFAVDKCLFTGDLFYNRTIGRIDLPGGNRKIIVETVKSVISEFEGYVMYPGHGESFLLDLACIDLLMRSFNAS